MLPSAEGLSFRYLNPGNKNVGILLKQRTLGLQDRTSRLAKWLLYCVRVSTYVRHLSWAFSKAGAGVPPRRFYEYVVLSF
jgi:hypothetical protein